MPLSIVIHTKNAAQTLPAALSSVQFADEIVIIDMESSDDTVEIAKKAGAHVYPYQDLGYADPARNFGLGKAHHDWILVLDADEEIPATLKTVIQSIVAGQAQADLQGDVYHLARKNLIFDQWLHHTGWWPDYQLRLFKKGTVAWRSGVHQLPDAHGKEIFLPAEEESAILHHNYQSVDQFINRLNRYTTIKAAELSKARRKRKQSFKPSSATVMGTFGNEFLSRFFSQGGIQDGVHGMSLSLLQAMYELVVQLKVWQAAGFIPHKSQQTSIEALHRFQGDLNYWLADWHVHHAPAWQKWWWQLRRKYRR